MEQFSYPNIRSLFIPDPGYEFFDVDLDSADLRIVAWESDCKQLKAWFREGKKPYIELMKEYYHAPGITKEQCKEDQVWVKRYASFKSLCHGSNYLGTAAGVAPRVGLLVHETERVQKWYFGACPEIKNWHVKVIAQVDTKRIVRNVWNYRFPIFDRPDDSIYRKVVAWIPASSIAILMNHGYVEIDKNLPEVQVLLQVHDSLGGQYPIATSRDYKKLIVEACTIPLPYLDPLTIPAGIKISRLSWGDCK